MNAQFAHIVAALAGFLGVPIVLGLLRAFGFFAIVRERQCVVFELFGTVRLVLDRPGLHLPWLRLGPAAVLLPVFGRRHVVDLRLDQTYLRDSEISGALFEVLETQNLLKSPDLRVTLVPADSTVLVEPARGQ